MNRHATSDGYEANDVVPRYRSATPGDPHPHVFHALHDNAARRRAAPARPGEDFCRVELIVLFAGPDQPNQAIDRGLRMHVPVANGDVQRLEAAVTQRLGNVGEQIVAFRCTESEALLAQQFGHLISTIAQRLLAALLAEPLPNLCRSPRCPDEAEPIPARPSALGGDDLDDVARLQLGGQRDEPAVDTSAGGAVADFGVNCVGEVDRGGSPGQALHIPVGGQDEHLVLIKIEFEACQEFGRVLVILGYLRQPTDRDDPSRFFTLLVGPVGRHPVLGAVVHVAGPNLDLERLAVDPHHRRMERLVEVELRHGDVVLEAAVNRGPPRMNNAEGCIAIGNFLRDDADPDQVVDLVEGPSTVDHLSIDAVDVLGTPGDLGTDPVGVEQVGHLGDRGGNEGIAFSGPSQQQSDDLLVSAGVENRKAAILHLVLDLLNAQSVGKRCVHVERFGRDPLLFLLTQRMDRPDVVETIGQLDDEHPHVTSHRHDHLADRRRLLLLAVGESDSIQLGDTVDECRHRLAVFFRHRLDREFGVLDRVVQQGSDHRLGVHSVPGQEVGDGERMGDVRLARLPALTRVQVAGCFVRSQNQVVWLMRVIVAKPIQHRRQIGDDLTTRVPLGVSRHTRSRRRGEHPISLARGERPVRPEPKHRRPRLQATA